MQLINSPKQILGLDISELSIKAVEIQRRGGQRYIQAMNSVVVNEGLIEEGSIKDIDKVALMINKVINKSSTKFKSKFIVASLPEIKTFIKVLEISNKNIKNGKIDELIKEELPRHMPLSIEEVQIDWQKVSSDREASKFLVGAVPKIVAEEYIQVCETAGFEVVALEIEEQAIMRAIMPIAHELSHSSGWLNKFNNKKTKIGQNKQDTKPKIVLDLGATRTGLSLVDNGVIQFANSLSTISGEKITQAIMNEKKLSFKEAEKAKIICGSNPKKCRGAVLNIIKKFIDDLAIEIINANDFYQEHFGHETEKLEILLSGGGANLQDIDVMLKKKISRNIKIVDPLINLNKNLPKKVTNLISYTTAIGLALRE